MAEGDGGDAGSTTSTTATTTTTQQAEWTPPATKEDFNEIIERRVARERAKYAGWDELKEKAERLDQIESERASDQQKAVREAQKAERDKAKGEFVPRVVRAEFKAAAKGVISAEQLSALMEDLDLGKYVDDNGEPDEAKIGKKVQAFAPTPDSRSRALGQGNHQQVTVRPGDRGLAEAQKRFGNKNGS